MYASVVKIIPISQFRDSYRYLFADGRNAPLGAVNVAFSQAPRAFAARNPQASHQVAQTLLTFLPSEATSIDHIIGIGLDFIQRLDATTPGFVVYHGPPYEQVIPHLHGLYGRPTHTDGTILRQNELTAECKRVAGAIRDDYGLASPTIAHNHPSFRPAMRGDEFTFYEWVTTTGIKDELDTAASADEFFSILNFYGIAYQETLTADGRPAHILADATGERFAGVGASRLGCAHAALTDRFGTFDIPEYDPQATVTSYPMERHDKYPAEIVDLHAEYRREWMEQTYPLLEQGRKRIRQGCDTVIRQAKGLARRLAPPDWPASRRALLVDELREMFRQERTTQLRDLDLSLPPKPPGRVGDWLRRLASPATVPPAAVYEGVTWEPDAPLTIDFGVDPTVWHDGRRIGHFDGERRFVLHGSGTRPQSRAFLPREAQCVDVHPDVDPESLGLAAHVPVRRLPLPAVPDDVRALLEQHPLPESQRAIGEQLVAVGAEPTYAPPPLPHWRRRRRR
jgi:hypothetical protein